MVQKFCEKFSYAEERFTSLHLKRVVQCHDKDVLIYVKRFREKAIEIQDSVTEKQIAEICIEGMLLQYKMHVVNHKFEYFSSLSLAARNLSEIV